jgi:hypothetical protein
MTSLEGYELHAGLIRLHVLMRMHTPTLPGTHKHERTHRLVSNTYSFSTATMIGELASVLRYAYISCLVVRCHGASFRLIG